MATHVLYTSGSLNETALAEDVANAPLRMFPESAPLTATMGTRPMHNPLCSFPVDSMARVTRSTNQFSASGYGATSGIAVAESETFTSTTARYKNKLNSVAEIQNVSDAVSGTMRAVDIHGFPDRLLTVTEELFRKLVQDREWSNWWSPGQVVGGADLDSGGGTYTARQTQGVAHWIMKTGLQRTKIGASTGITDGNGNVFGTSTGNVPLELMTWCKDLAGVDLDRAAIHEMCLNMIQLGADPNGIDFWMSSIARFLFTSFANTANGAINNRMVSADAKILHDVLSVYETAHGYHTLRSAPHYLDQAGLSQTVTQSSGSTVVALNSVCFAIKPGAYKQGILRGTELHTVAKTGDFTQVAATQEKGVVCPNPLVGAGLVNCVNITA